MVVPQGMGDVANTPRPLFGEARISKGGSVLGDLVRDLSMPW